MAIDREALVARHRITLTQPNAVSPLSVGNNEIGPFLAWQQPHAIYYTELLWRAQIVFETAEFMASFPELDGERYILAPPLIPAQEFYNRTTVVNPTFELAYWYWGLETAQRWRERLGLARGPAWERVKNNLAAPSPRDGVYPGIESEPYTMRNDHPSMLMALGFVPQTPLIDPEVICRTLRSVKADWDWPSTWAGITRCWRCVRRGWATLPARSMGC